ncbi:methionyl-tRNA formyltransferase [Candidatus Peribacteria bacterium]|nr:MAG: methionyl-tRNA formyltransferase [Candidatus Peribacteria bacterium]
MSHSVIFCGTPDFAVPSLQALLNDAAFDVTLVITQPDRPVGRKQILTPPPVKELALEKGIPVFQPENINLELQTYLDTAKIARPDFLIVVAYGKILKQPILDLPKVAPINVHGSILPRWRGASPVEHAILNGDTETGVTIQIMSAGLDEGPVLSIGTTQIDPRETSTSLREKLCVIGAKLLVDTLKKPLDPQPQPDTGITICGKLSREDARVNPETMTADELDRCVRALNPWPSVLATVDGHEIKILDAALEPTAESMPLACAHQTTLHLLTIQEAGGKPVKAADWKRGLRN